MNSYNEYFGITKEQIRKIIDQKFKENADILIGVDDPEVNELINVLVDAFSDAIVENNDQITSDVEDYIEKNYKKNDGNRFRF